MIETQIAFKDYLKTKKELEIDIIIKKDNSIKSSLSRTIQKVYDYAFANDWDYFFTMTFNPSKVDRYNYDDVCKKLKIWLDYFRRINFNLKYLIVPELHEDGAFHFHALFSNVNENNLTDSGHTDRQGRIIYNISSYNLGFTTVTKTTDSESAANYITKYLTKSLVLSTFGKKKYWCSKNLDLPIENKIVMKNNEIELLLENIEKKITFEKVITIDSDVYQNTIKIFHTKYNIK